MNRFEGKHLLVTGGTSGIGEATARRLVDEGAEVIVTGRNAEKLARLNDRSGFIAIENDAADPQASAALAAAVDERFGGQLDGLFLNAGFGLFSPHDEIDQDKIARQFDVNVRGVMLHMAHLAPKIRDGGAALITSSIVVTLGMPGSAIYAASKGAVQAAMRAYATELAGRQVRVNTISPGPIETGFFDATNIPKEDTEGMVEQVQSQVPLGRLGRPEEIASAAAFLLSDDASYVTGTELIVDGGMS